MLMARGEGELKRIGILAVQPYPFAGVLNFVLGKIENDSRAWNADGGTPQSIVDVVVVLEIVKTAVRAAILPISNRNKTAAIDAVASWQKGNIVRGLQSVVRSARHHPKKQHAKHRRSPELL